MCSFNFTCDVCGAELDAGEPMVSLTRVIECATARGLTDVLDAIQLGTFCRGCRPTDGDLRRALEVIVGDIRERRQRPLWSSATESRSPYG